MVKRNGGVSVEWEPWVGELLALGVAWIIRQAVLVLGRPFKTPDNGLNLNLITATR